MTLPVLPQDVFDEIIGQLTGETSALKSCSLVCRSFRRSAQKMLFNHTFVMLAYDDNDNPSAYIGPDLQPSNLFLIVKHAPHLIEYIQELNIHCYGGTYPPNFNASDAADLANALGTFSRKGEFTINLRSFSFEIDGLRRWDDITSWAQHALMLLMSVDSLQHISLDGILECPADIFQNLPLLKHLSLTTTTFSSLPTTQKERPKLESLTICFLTEARGRLDQFSNNVERVVNTTQLKTFKGGHCTPSTMPVIERILQPTSNSLEYLTLKDSEITNTDSVSINLNQFSHLTDITIYQCYFVERMPPLLILITKAMKNISHRNAIQNLSVRLDVDSTFNIVGFASIMKDVWQEVDMIWSIPQLLRTTGLPFRTFYKTNCPRQTTQANCILRHHPFINRFTATGRARKSQGGTTFYWCCVKAFWDGNVVTRLLATLESFLSSRQPFVSDNGSVFMRSCSRNRRGRRHCITSSTYEGGIM